jgi:hypothetical protein
LKAAYDPIAGLLLLSLKLDAIWPGLNRPANQADQKILVTR